MVSGVTAGAWLPPEQSPASPTTDRQTSLESFVSGSNDPSTSRASVFLLEDADGFVLCSGPAPDAVVDEDVKSILFCRASALSRDFQASSSRRSAVLSPPASITIDRVRLAARLTPFPARAFFLFSSFPAIDRSIGAIESIAGVRDRSMGNISGVEIPYWAQHFHTYFSFAATRREAVEKQYKRWIWPERRVESARRESARARGREGERFGAGRAPSWWG